jgi:signal transduction histidine kinase
VRDPRRLIVLALTAVGIGSFAYVLVAQSQLRWTAGDVVWDALTVIPFFALGIVIGLQRPDHPEARLLCLLGTSLVVGIAMEAFAERHFADPVPPSSFWVLNLAYTLLSVLQVVAAGVLIGLFPDGVAEPRWVRWVVRLLWAFLAIPFVQLLADQNLAVNPYLGVDPTQASPFHVPALSGLAPALDQLAVLPLPTVVGVVLLAVRYRTAAPSLKVRMRWLLLLSVLGLGTVVVLGGLSAVGASGERWDRVSTAGSLAAGVLFLAALCVAILRQALFELDLVVRRSAAYALLWLGIGLLYVALAATPGLALSGRIPVQVAVLVTIMVSMAFQPLRRRLESLAARLVFGRRANRYEVLQAFGASLEQSIGITNLLPRVADAVQLGLGAPWVRVSVRTASPESSYPAHAQAGTVAGEAALSHEVRRGDEVVGLIECGAKAGGYDDADRALLDTLTGQAATAVANVWLTAELSEQVRQLDRSRARLVTAQDEERRRIERNIHDGAQQEIVAMLTKLGLARTQVARGDDLGPLLLELHGDARDLLRELRELAQGIHPSVLGDNGLVSALRARSARLPLPVAIRADEVLVGRRLDVDLEAAAYFIVSEALTNVVKHARAESARIDLNLTATCLRIAITDDGLGPGTGRTAGTGLLSMRDRAETVGGRLAVTAGAAGGTVVRAELPVVRPVVGEAHGG